MDVVRLAYYPFLEAAKEAVRELGPGLDAVLNSSIYSGVRLRAMDRVQGALDNKTIPPVVVTDERGALQELLSVPVARMLTVLLAERTLVMRYATAEGARLEDVLLQDPDALHMVHETLDVPAQKEGAAWRIHFSDYLRLAPTQESDWKLIHRDLRQGWVMLSDAALAGLCRYALEQNITESLLEEIKKPVHDEVRGPLQKYVDELAPKLAEAREKWGTGDFGKVQRDLFPPCIHNLFNDMKDGKMIPHHGRFAMASFLGTIGMTVEDVMDYFKEVPNFDPEKSRYQIEHILGDRGVDGYTPPGCGWMQTNGVCPLEQRDNLCFKIKHPLSYYRARINFRKRNQADDPHMKKQDPGQDEAKPDGEADAKAGTHAGPAKEAQA